jgi:hypothetical protein
MPYKDKAVGEERSMCYRDNHRVEEKARANKHYKKHKENRSNIISWLEDKYTGVPCMDCDGVFDWVAMDFDHRPEETKSFGLATKGTLVANPENIAKIMKEVDKCDLICSNCHRVRTWRVRQNG